MIAPRAVATTIEQAHHDAVTDTISWLEKNATYALIVEAELPRIVPFEPEPTQQVPCRDGEFEGQWGSSRPWR